MKKLLTRLAVVLAMTSYTPKTEYVYLCDSSSSYAYHRDFNCRGLQHCKHGIFRTTKDSAINYYNRRPCKICY